MLLIMWIVLLVVPTKTMTVPVIRNLIPTFTLDLEPLLRNILPVPSKRICRFTNDPHYNSFDNFQFDFHGQCEHTLTRPCYCERMPSCLRDFEVFALNKPCYTPTGSYRPACVHQIGIRLRENNGDPNAWTEFELTRSPASVKMTNNLGNDVIVNDNQFFAVSQCVGVFVTHSPSQKELYVFFYGYGYMRISIGVLATNAFAEIELDRDLAGNTRGKLCGICGQHKFNTGRDDFVLDNGQQFTPFVPPGALFQHLPQAFYNHYTRFSDPDGCDPRGQFGIAETGQIRKKRDIECDEGGFCENAFAFEGFDECFAELGEKEVSTRLRECQADFCSSRDDACSNIASVVATCEDGGTSVENWREKVGCQLNCTDKSHYAYGIGGSVCIAGKNVCGGSDLGFLLKVRKNSQMNQLIRNCGREKIRDGCVCDSGYGFDTKRGKCVRSSKVCVPSTRLSQALFFD